jgi:hypothetical protein
MRRRFERLSHVLRWTAAARVESGRLFGVGMAYVVTFVLVRRVWPFSLDAPWWVITAMICVLGLASMVRPLARLRMPAPLRRVRPWEVHGRIVRWLGVRRFGRLLRQTPLRLLNTHVYMRTGEHDVSRVLQELEAAEVSHAVSALLTLPYLWRAAVMGWWASVLSVAIANVVINVLPILHLRLAREAVTRRDRAGRRVGRST